jgi:hypothetical protein
MLLDALSLSMMEYGQGRWCVSGQLGGRRVCGGTRKIAPVLVAVCIKPKAYSLNAKWRQSGFRCVRYSTRAHVTRATGDDEARVFTCA